MKEPNLKLKIAIAKAGNELYEPLIKENIKELAKSSEELGKLVIKLKKEQELIDEESTDKF